MYSTKTPPFGPSEKRFTLAGKSIAGEPPATLSGVPYVPPPATLESIKATLKEEVEYDEGQLMKDLISLRNTCQLAMDRLSDGKTPMFLLQGVNIQNIDTRIAKMTEKKALLAMIEGKHP